MGKSVDRVRALDALRGLAALAVVIHHWSLAFLHLPPAAPGDTSILPRLAGLLPRILQTGTADVMIFFVLSGFVLALSLEAAGETYRRYLVKRVFRIMPPLMLAVLLSAGLYLLIDPAPLAGLQPWFYTAGWTERPDAGIVLGHWALLDSPRFVSLDSVIWTLRHEMRISLFFPLIAWWVASRPNRALLVSLLVSASVAVLTRYVSGSVQDWLMSLHYSFLFFCGAWLAERRAIVRAWMAGRSRLQRAGMLGLALVLLVFAPSSLKGAYLLYAGAIILVAQSSADKRLVPVLEQGPLLYLGKISYSLYLLHVPILYAMVHLLHGVWPVWAIIAGGMLVSFAASDLFNRVVEKPSQRIGRAISVRI